LSKIEGVGVGTAAAGIRYRDRDDLVLFALPAEATTSAVFTRNAFCAAPVVVAREHLRQALPRFLLVNAGNANAGTGTAGMEAAQRTCALIAETGGCRFEQVLPFSTGVIGMALPVEKIAAKVPELMASLAEDGWMRAARAIMTTDTVMKGVSRQVHIAGSIITVTGIAKGSGMIRPDMATMLAYVATDVSVARATLDSCLQKAVAESFNCITVDGDTSTNDACVLMASGASGCVIDSAEKEAVFQQVLNDVCRYLAQAIIRDGEGATKFISIIVEQARDLEEAREVAFTVAHSPLVKTALFASDPNWGRILAAVGRAPIDKLDIHGVNLFLDEVCVIRGGEPAAEYSEEKGQAVLSREEITIRISLQRGEFSATVWTTDFSYDYVRINADYRS
jgi:glutamate N-acetyltransferase/amino-acid N-acetyltransferase